MITAVTQVSTLTTIRRRRVLPANGKVLVRRGQKVEATDVVASADLAPQHLLMDIARGLGLPPDQAGSYIQRRTGEMVSAGDLLAGPAGLAKRVVRAPRPGVVSLIKDGKLLLKVESPAFELQAGLPGTVVSIISERGAIIETAGGLVQGVWGNGRLASGILARLADRPEEVFSPDQLDVKHRGAVLVAGYCEDAQVLRAAAELPVKGMILASLSAALIPEASALPFPVMLTEGFGLVPMNSAAFTVLTTGDPAEVVLNAEAFDPLMFRRPEIILLRKESVPPAEGAGPAMLAPKQRVRITRAPYRSQVGVVIQLGQGMESLPNGLKAFTASIRLENGEIVVSPLANLEILD
jgi:hypothetical protein